MQVSDTLFLSFPNYVFLGSSNSIISIDLVSEPLTPPSLLQFWWKSVPVLFYFRYVIFRSKTSYSSIIEHSYTSLRSFSANYNTWVTSGLISCNHVFSWVLGHIFLLFVCLVILDYILDIMNDVLQKLWILVYFCLFINYAELTLQTLSPLVGK